MFDTLRVRLRALFSRSATEREIDEEMRFHLEQDVARHRAAGLSEEAARRAATHDFGSVGYLKDEVRESFGLGWLERLAQDIRFGLRSFRRSPAFVATVVATIALALGLNTTVFTVFNAYMLRPVSVSEPNALYQMMRLDRRGRNVDFSWRQFLESRAVPTITDAFAYRMVFAHRDDQPFLGALVSGNYFGMLGGGAMLGRTLIPDDAAVPGSGAVMVLSYRAWQTRFGADSSVIGRMITIKDQPMRVVGVAARDFDGISAVPPDFWAPLTMIGPLLGGTDLFGPTEPERVRVIVRVAPGASEHQAADALSAWMRRTTQDRPDSLKARGAELMSVASTFPITDETIVVFVPVMIAFALVMLIACANVANVMLARGIARQREIGIRLALGAARGRLIRQLLTESMLLALPAAALGYVISRLTLDGALRLMMRTVPAEFASYIRLIPLGPDLRVFAFLLVAALAAAVLFGLAPAIQATRPDVVAASRGDFDAGVRTNRLRGALVAFQVTVCVLLLVCTGILLQGARRAGSATTGMKTSGLVQILLQDRGRQSIIARLEALPNVTTVVATTESPIDGMLPGVAVRAGAANRRVAFNFVSPSYFAAFGVTILRGRGFTEADAAQNNPVAIVSDAMAQALWPGADPIGQTLSQSADPSATSSLARVRTVQVVGVASNTVTGWVGTGLQTPLVYFPVALATPGTRLFVRASGDANEARRALIAELAAAAPGAVEETHTANEILAVQIYPFRAGSWIAGAIGGVALLLTLTGIYGVLSYLVAQRTREIGIRMALGARASEVVRMILGESARLAAFGLVAGLVLAFGLAKLIASELYLIDALDPTGYAIGMAVVIAAYLLASLLPARRAVRIDPVVALRSD